MTFIAIRGATSRTAHQLLHPFESEFSSVDLFEIVLLLGNMPGISCQSGDIIVALVSGVRRGNGALDPCVPRPQSLPLLCSALSQPRTVRICRLLITSGGVVDLLVFVFVKEHPVYPIDFDLLDAPAPDVTKCFV